MEKIISKLCCPACKSKLEIDNTSLSCNNCKIKFFFENGIFNFSNLTRSETYDYYEDKFGSASISDINEDKRKYISRTLGDERSHHLISNIHINKGWVVDFGTGRGLIAGTLKSLKGDLKIIGYDISPKACRSALNSGFVDFAICCDDDIPLTDNSVDAAIMGDLIEHLLDPEHFLNEVHRILIPGGILSLSTPNVSFIRNRITMMRGEFPRTECDYSYEIWNARHIKFFNFNSIENILIKCGFRNIEIKGIRLLRGYKIPLIRILRYLIPDNLSYEMMVVKAKKGS